MPDFSKGANRMREAIPTSTLSTRAERRAVRLIADIQDRGDGAGPKLVATPRLTSDVVTCASAASIDKCSIAGANEVVAGNGAASEAHEHQRTSTGDGSFNKTVAAPAALNCQIIAMPGAIQVTFQRPVAPDQAQTIKGTLTAQVHARGQTAPLPHPRR